MIRFLDCLTDMLTHLLPPRQLGVTWQHVTCVLITGPRSYISWPGAIITSGLCKAALHCVTSANWLHPPQASNKCRPYCQLVGIRRTIVRVRAPGFERSTLYIVKTWSRSQQEPSGPLSGAFGDLWRHLQIMIERSFFGT